MKHTYGKTLRALSLAAALLVLFGAILCACGPSPASSSDAELTVVCTNFVGYDFVRTLVTNAGFKLIDNRAETNPENRRGENLASVILLSGQGQDMHGFEPSALDVARIASADLFVYVGGESDAWVDAALKAANNPDLVTVSMMDVCGTLLEEEEFDEDDDHDHDHDHDHGTEVEYDEHVWTSIRNAQAIVTAIGDALAAVFDDPMSSSSPESAKAAAAAYVSSLDEWRDRYEALAARSVRQTIVIADRYPFAYLMQECGLTCYAAFPGCSSETQASFATQVRLVETVKENDIPVIFTVDNSLGSVADTVAAQTGAKVSRLWSGQTMPGEPDPGTYLWMLRVNYDLLWEALN